MIDPVDIKKAVKSGQLKVFVKDSIIYISDTQTGDTVMIGNLKEERKAGKWIADNMGLDGYYANCSECGYQIDVHENRGYPNYCEYCGADMRGDHT